MPANSCDADWDPNASKSVDERAAEYTRLRQQCPVALGKDAWGMERFWSVTRYRDVQAVARDTEAYTNANSRLEIRRMPLESDPPEHGQIRRLLNPLLQPKAVARRSTHIRTIVRHHLADLVAGAGGDAIALLARPVPTKVLLNWLGQPEEDWELIKNLSDQARPQPVPDGEALAHLQKVEQALWDYSWQMVRQRQANPHKPADDPVCAILGGTIDGQPMPVEHAVGMVRLALAAGHDSTTQAFGIMIHFLATHPEIWRRLEHQRELIPAAIEETLRLNSPVVAMPRTARHDLTLNERQICAGERLLLFWASANRDPEVFDNGEIWDIDHARKPHMVFGHGVHFCAGAPLARQELLVLVEELLDACSSIRLAGEPVVQDMNQYGFASLPVAIQPR